MLRILLICSITLSGNWFNQIYKIFKWIYIHGSVVTSRTIFNVVYRVNLYYQLLIVAIKTEIGTFLCVLDEFFCIWYTHSVFSLSNTKICGVCLCAHAETWTAVSWAVFSFFRVNYRISLVFSYKSIKCKVYIIPYLSHLQQFVSAPFWFHVACNTSFHSYPEWDRAIFISLNTANYLFCICCSFMCGVGSWLECKKNIRMKLSGTKNNESDQVYSRIYCWMAYTPTQKIYQFPI